MECRSREMTDDEPQGGAGGKRENIEDAGNSIISLRLGLGLMCVVFEPVITSTVTESEAASSSYTISHCV